MAGNAAVSLTEVLNRLWVKHLPQIEERAAVLQTAAEHLAGGGLTRSDQELAASEAHKLAGALGTFGISEGTELAREAETLYESNLDGNDLAKTRLRLIAARLESLISNRSTSDKSGGPLASD